MFKVGDKVVDDEGLTGVVKRVDRGAAYPVTARMQTVDGGEYVGTFTADGIYDCDFPESSRNIKLLRESKFKVGDDVVDGLGNRGVVEELWDLSFRYPVQVRLRVGQADRFVAFTPEGLFDLCEVDSVFNIKLFEVEAMFKVGDRVVDTRGNRGLVADIDKHAINYPITVRWDPDAVEVLGTTWDEYTPDGKFYANGDRPERNIRKAGATQFNVGDKVTDGHGNDGVVVGIRTAGGVHEIFPVVVRTVIGGNRRTYTADGRYTPNDTLDSLWSLRLLSSSPVQEEGYGFVPLPEEQPEAPRERIEVINGERLRGLPVTLLGSFVWRSSEEGWDFWNDIHERLQRVVRNAS